MPRAGRSNVQALQGQGGRVRQQAKGPRRVFNARGALRRGYGDTDPPLRSAAKGYGCSRSASGVRGSRGLIIWITVLLSSTVLGGGTLSA